MTIRARSAGILAAVAVITAVAAVPAAAGSVQTARAGPGQQFYAMQWNIAGATTKDDPKEPNNFGFSAVVGRLADLAHDWRPAVISINEACDEQVVALRLALEVRGLHVRKVAFSGTAPFQPGLLPGRPNPACLRWGGYFPGVALLSLVQEIAATYEADAPENQR